ncbi:MAG: DsbA family protein [Chloroflexota bacterium]|nr:DsbA family protein [Chloroflexota bacterium]
MADLTVPVHQDDHVQGPATAAVTLVEYADYECPYCADAYPVVQELQRQLGGRLRFVYRHFPRSDVHPHARHAAEAAEAAAAQGKFWEMDGLLFEYQLALTNADLERYAADLDLTMDTFKQAMAQHSYGQRVQEDITGGTHSGVRGTPTFFINGMRHDDTYTLDVLLPAITKAPGSQENQG